GPVAGLIDAEAGNRLVQSDRIVVATGRRDMGLAFPGWDTPGVAGLHAAQVLNGLYDGFSGSSVVVLGGTNNAVSGALALHAAGIHIAGIVEASAALPCDPALADQLRAAGIPVHLSEVPRNVIAKHGEVSGLQLRQAEVACDTILLGVGAVPMIDLLQAAGARCEFRADLSGFVPVLTPSGETTLPGIFAVGDCAGIPAATTAQMLNRQDFDLGAYRKAWVRDTVAAVQDDMPVCLCETVTARDILELRPPAYLNAPPRANSSLTLANLLDVGPPDPDQVKRLTRAGMGACQGRRCREQVQALLALQDDLAMGDVPLAGYRAPVRPIPLNQAALPEDPSVTEQWDPWMGIPLQWAPYWHIGPRYTVASLKTGEEYVNE
ncbi:MAG: NAD(P)/FAD-dependent oxidoreductase, partial [Pseudomonadota bacterium]|nr:NAD(P)/FAD-dependent oxidoreductase [Pseudomonadota bacterium]